MANEISVQTQYAAGNFQFSVQNGTSQWWNTGTSAFEAYNAANIANYGTAMSQQGASGEWVGTMPAAVAGVYNVKAYKTAGASMVVGDLVNIVGANPAYQWSGTVVIPLSSLATPTNITAGTITTVTNLTNLPSIPANWLTAAGINAGALNGKGDWLLASSYTAPPTAAANATAVWQDSTAGDFTTAGSIGKTLGGSLGTSVFTAGKVAEVTLVDTVTTVTNQLTAAQVATGVWQDTVLGDFTTAGSIGKSLFTSGNAPGAASGIALVGSNMGTVSSVTGSVGSVTAAVALSAGDSSVIQSGTAAAGGASTITIATAIGTTADLVGCKIKITGGTGANQERVITGYVNSTKVVTVDYAWVTAPDNTSIYSILFDNAPVLNSSLAVSAGSIAGVTFPTNFSALLISAGGHISNVDTLTTYTGNTPQTGDCYALIGATGSGLTALASATNMSEANADLDELITTIGVAGAGLTGITGAQLATGQKVDVDTIKTNPVVNAGTVTFPTGATLASTTNITAGTITTVTNLTNAPTVGDLTAAMKTSVTTAATAATPIAASVSGNVVGSVGSVVGAVGSVTARVTANTDQLAGQTVTAAAGVTFPTSVASPTNITAGVITTVTNLTNAPTVGDLTAAMKTSVQTAADAAITANVTIVEIGADVDELIATVGTPLTAAQIATGVWQDSTAGDFTTAGSIGKTLGGSLGTSVFTAGKVAEVILVDTLITYTNNTPQTGDTYALAAGGNGFVAIKVDTAEISIDTDELIATVGVAGIGLTNLGDARIANLDATVSSRVATAHFDTILGMPAVSVSADIAEIEGEVDTLIAGVTLTSGAVDAIWAKTMTELGAVPDVTDSVLAALEWLFLLARNKITQTSTTQTLRNNADAAPIGSAAVSDDGTTFTRAKWS